MERSYHIRGSFNYHHNGTWQWLARWQTGAQRLSESFCWLSGHKRTVSLSLSISCLPIVAIHVSAKFSRSHYNVSLPARQHHLHHKVVTKARGTSAQWSGVCVHSMQYCSRSTCCTIESEFHSDFEAICTRCCTFGTRNAKAYNLKASQSLVCMPYNLFKQRIQGLMMGFNTVFAL